MPKPVKRTRAETAADRFNRNRIDRAKDGIRVEMGDDGMRIVDYVMRQTVRLHERGEANPELAMVAFLAAALEVAITAASVIGAASHDDISEARQEGASQGARVAPFIEAAASRISVAP